MADLFCISATVIALMLTLSWAVGASTALLMLTDGRRSIPWPTMGDECKAGEEADATSIALKQHGYNQGRRS